MVMDARSAAALAGVVRPPAAPEPHLRIWVVRAFLLDGKRVEQGQVVDLVQSLARELISSGKAEAVKESPPPAPKPEPAPRAPAAKKKDDEDDAR